MRRLLVFLPLVLVLDHVTSAQQQPPVGDLAVGAGDASISGRVVDRHSERALEGALMTLETTDRKRRLVTLTDATGSYAFEHIAAGEYRVIASHGDFVTHTFDLRDGGMPVNPRDGILVMERSQTRRGVDFALRRGGSVAGRVSSHDGKPLKDAQATVTLRVDNGFSEMVTTLQRTSDSGNFVLRNLPEGSYLISAFWSDPDAPRSAMGSRRTYFPSVDNPRDALPVTLLVGETVRNIDIVVPLTEMLTIKGTFVRSGDAGEIDAFLLDAGTSAMNVIVDPEGRFSTPRVRAGRYTLVGRAYSEDGWQAAMLTAEVTAEMQDLVLPLLPTGAISGRVVTDNGMTVPGGVQIAAVLADGGKELDPYRRDRADIADNGAFSLAGLFGERVMRLTGVTDGWTVERVTVGKTPATSLTFDPGSTVDDVLIVLTRR